MSNMDYTNICDMKNQDRFQDLKQRVDLYFDNALSKDDENDLLKRVDDDPRCSKIFNKEKSFRDYIKNNVKRPSVSADFVKSIKDRIKLI